MGERELSRREVLAGLTAVGGVGAAAGGATGALFTDRDSFADNALTSGVVDLKVTGEDGEATDGTATVSVDLDGDDRAERREFTLSLPGAANNPVYLWLRTTSCPERSRLARALTVTVSRRCDDGQIEPLITGSFHDVVSALRGGTYLDTNCSGGTPTCLEPDETAEVFVTVELDEDFRGKGSTSIGLEFLGHQCRHTKPQNPFPAETCSHTPAISFVAFCSESEGSFDPEVTVLSSDGDGPTAVEWSTALEVDYLVVKGGRQMTIYDYRNDDDRTLGTAVMGDDGADVTSYDVQPGEASTPCAVADQLLEDSDSFSATTSTKLEYEDGSFEEETEGSK